MTRDTRRGLLTAAACGAAAGLVLAYAPQPATPAPDPDRNADVPAALARSQTHGWPHRPTVREAQQVARFVHREVRVTTAARSATACRNVRWDAGLWACRSVVTFTHDELTGARLPSPRVYRFRTVVRVWEDGSASVFYPEGR